MKRDRRQHGFALLLCLVLVLIAGIALAAAARQSATEALSAREATESLQRRWAVTSCRATLLPRVDGLLADTQQIPTDADGKPLPISQRPAPKAQVWITCNLSGIDFDLVLTDEQAKYHPTVLQQFVPDRDLRLALSQLAEPGRRTKASPAVLLRPMIGLNPDGTVVEQDDPSQPPIEVYTGYGQLFEDLPPADLVGSDERPGPAMRVTCWGSGKLNIKRASVQVVERALLPLLGADGVYELLQARAENPWQSPEDWMKRVVSAEPEKIDEAMFLLTEVSNCQGLWVIARGRTRSWYALSIREYTPPSDAEHAKAQQETVEPDATNPGPADPEEEEDELDPLQVYDYAW